MSRAEGASCLRGAVRSVRTKRERGITADEGKAELSHPAGLQEDDGKLIRPRCTLIITETGSEDRVAQVERKENGNFNSSGSEMSSPGN